MRFWLCALGLAVSWNGAMAVAQDDATPTLHVYTNLIQLPVLVLGAGRQPLASVDTKKFTISVDGGPPFRATHVRPEGDDPISLSILIDVGEAEQDLLPRLDEAVADLVPRSLSARDHVSIYGLDCAVRRTLDDVPAEHDELKRAVGEALQSWTNRKRDKHRTCQNRVYLWDALGVVTEQMSELPGRRVVLVITSGVDKNSTYKWPDVRVMAQVGGVAIFGMSYVPDFAAAPWRIPEDDLNAVCELSGGMVFTTNGRELMEDLRRVVARVRGRYIVEFPRPSNSTIGTHGLVVRIDKVDAFIRPSGISIPMADPTLLADPNTVPSDPSRAPEQGSRRVNAKSH